jgi:HSP20 family molecular chaperone IbpA
LIKLQQRTMFLSLTSPHRGGCWAAGREQRLSPFFEVDINHNDLNELLSSTLGPILAATSNEFCRKRKEAQDKAAAAAKKPRFEVKLSTEGYKPEELDVKLVDDNTLIVSGKHEHSDESGTVSKTFTRKWNIPENVELAELACNFNTKDNTVSISAPWKVELPLPKVQEKIIPITLVRAENSTQENGDDDNNNAATPTTTTPLVDENIAKTEDSKDPTVAA